MSQTEYIGAGAIANLTTVLAKLSAKHIFLVTGKKSYASSGAESLLETILSPFHVTRFSEFSANPNINDLRNGIALLTKQTYDCIIAVGGGSVLDMAKLLKNYALQSNALEQLIKTNTSENPPLHIPLIAIPTTSGSGSEATHFAVIYIEETKHSAANKDLLPDVAIVDYTLTMDLSPKLTAVSGMDALSQAIESYWSVHSTNESQQYASEAIQMIFRNITPAVKAPAESHREQMSRAAHLAGKAINITKTTAPHAISYTLTSRFGVPHGHAVALTLGSLFVYNADVTERDVTDFRGVNHVRKTMNELCSLLGCIDPQSAQRTLKQLMRDISLSTTLSGVGVTSAADRDLIAGNVNTERLLNNPRVLTREALKRILENLA